MLDRTERYFELVVENPHKFGSPDKVETLLLAAVSIWAMNNLGDDENYVCDALLEECQNTPELMDSFNVSFASLSEHETDYRPVVNGMKAVFEDLKKLAEDPPCSQCGSREADIQPHSCPYQEEINNDSESLCRCCPCKEAECAADGVDEGLVL